MKKQLLFLAASLLLVCCQSAKKDTESKETATETSNTMEQTNPATDYLHVPGPISFNQKEYFLSWSSHPGANYYKHEYLPKGVHPEHFDQMIMLEVALGELIPLDIANGKATEIESRKKADAMAGYSLFENKTTGEVLLDFMLSAENGDADIVEWNSYRYKSFTDPSGQKGIVLFALSKRGYGSEGTAFASDIQSNRKKYVAEFEALKFPEVKL